MAYGDYNGPDKEDKGQENGSCNRSLCQEPNAKWFNHGSRSWYCDDCREDLEAANRVQWQRDFYPSLGHPMFETREMIDERQSQK